MEATKIESKSGNFPEQFSDSSNNADISRISQTNKVPNSPCEDELSQHFPKSETSPMLEGDLDNLGNSNGSPTSTKTTSKQTATLGKANTSSSLPASINDEKDIKKEETSLSPQNMSPLGIGSVNNEKDENVKNVNLSPMSGGGLVDKSVRFFRSPCNESEERSKSTAPPNLDTNSNNTTSMSPKTNTDNYAPNIPNMPRNLNPFNGNLPKFNCPTQSDSGSCTDYLQQQNHVFVFSTQLANRSAEAVMGGQFPTIISYHCMQPSTKMFLEDFLKNSAKTTKLQRQYSMNIMNAMQSGQAGPGTQPPWLNECNNAGKFGSSRSGMRKNNPAWEQNQLLDGPANPMDILSNPDAFEDIKPVISGIKLEDKSCIPSLQGVKVPDENLTPQQRQHREEQLAKIKKMNKFLFPESEGGEFAAGQANNNSSEEMTSNSGGNCPDIRNMPGGLGKPSNFIQGNNNNLDNIADIVLPTDMMSAAGDLSNMMAMQLLKQECISKGNTSNINANKSRADHDSNQDMAPSSFNANNCPSSESDTIGVPPNINMSPEEWVKFQNNIFGDNFKHRHVGPPTAVSRSSNRNNNAPPPPYHQTQRSASVPIATQSPTTQPSPNNSIPDMPLTSPQGGRVPLGVSSTPPQMDISNLSTSTTNPTQTSTSTSSFGSNVKNLFARDLANANNPGYCHNAGPLNSLNTNPLLAHMSPREMDCLDNNNKTKRSSPQKCKSPLMNELPDSACLEPKYANFGLNYSTCGGMPPMNAQNLRQHMQQHMPPQFGRRMDNMHNIPLNPNCNRVSQNKPTNNFDPIASLAQMSQSLTGCGMSLNTMSAGNNMGGGVGAGGGGLMDVNPGDLMAGPGRPGDPTMDHCNQIANNNSMMGLAGALGRVTGQFNPDINNMLCGDPSSMNGKMCLPGNFNHSALTGVGLRDTMQCNDMMSSNRQMNRRMPPNFDNFNMTPNVHVKVSAPNTIQYMPARSQNMNNMRGVPPNMEFFQRYGNPQNLGHGHNELPNPNMMNMFGNCQQQMANLGNIGPMGGRMGGGGVGFEPNDLESEGNLMPNDAYMNVP